ncbi:hypothetical protein THSYN_24930 [Candidatus Thiodictyon syntrophicum]|uniref:Glycosyl transferase family 1 domain-containing protein n=1 Tax=Candidatus Thiodictyon syntrophicum TaxID=1166950 RepID=A0A2K8UE48_9GAMM|nr:hypothetical protein THSYN_24930 [Candidatus Thiodictyon syntrophicum]
MLAVRPLRRALLDRIRSTRTPVMLRKALVTWSYLRHSGMFTDFSQATQPYLTVLAREFQPQATWGLFGNTDCWLIAQRLGRLAGCPWAADMKDSWEVFMPSTLQTIIARRFSDMAASTANAEFNAQVLSRWFPSQPCVVYSGVDRSFADAAPTRLDQGVFRLTLTGSIYDHGSLEAFIDGLSEWLTKLTGVKPVGVEIVYAGGDHAIVRPALERLAGLARVEAHPYLPLPELAALCRSAAVNTYLWDPNCFHHKLLELLACGRPVLAFPGETEESRGLAADTGGELFCCAASADLAETLDLIRGRCPAPAPHDVCSASFTWAALAVRLERVFQQVTRQTRV